LRRVTHCSLPLQMSLNKSDFVEVNAVVGQPQPCQLTCAVLTQALVDSGYGKRVDIFRALLRRAEDGSALCNSCGLPIGQHAGRNDPVSVATGLAQRHDNDGFFPAPNCTIPHYSRNVTVRHSQIGAVSPVPLHWVGAAWYATFVDFVGHSRDVASRYTAVHAALKYRCNIEDCGQVFEVEGSPLAWKSKPVPAGPVSLRTMGNGETIESHMEHVHGLKHLPAGRLATRLFDCCKDPVAMTCCFAYGSSLTCTGDRLSTCGAIDRVFRNHTSPNSLALFGATLPDPRGITFVYSAPLDEVQCQCWLICGVMFDWALCPIVQSVLAVASIVTLFGFPCNSDSLPPFLCWPCYDHRRKLVAILGAAETPFQSRVKATFCCYCSEVQVWRELKASGVWPGLLCCTASAEDREYMSASAVRQRYSVDGAYSVRATSVEGARLLSAVHERFVAESASNLCYGMV
jgi:hypothetical protein